MSTQEKKKPFWVNAEMIMHMTGLDGKGMYRLRQNNPGWWSATKTGGYLYDLHQLPESMIKRKPEPAQ